VQHSSAAVRANVRTLRTPLEKRNAETTRQKPPAPPNRLSVIDREVRLDLLAAPAMRARPEVRRPAHAVLQPPSPHDPRGGKSHLLRDTAATSTSTSIGTRICTSDDSHLIKH